MLCVDELFGILLYLEYVCKHSECQLWYIDCFFENLIMSKPLWHGQNERYTLDDEESPPLETPYIDKK